MVTKGSSSGSGAWVRVAVTTTHAPDGIANPSVIPLEGLFADRDHVVGGKVRTRRNAIQNKFLPERVKARRFAEKSHERE